MGPRLFGIPATAAPVVAVLRRGPSDWSHVGRWDVSRGVYEPGSWIHANLYPQRCDLSPDGRWLSYFTLKPSARWDVGSTYLAISRLPWLTALAAWSTCGTWTNGAHFVGDRSVWEVGEPQHGDVGPCRQRFGMALTGAASFAVERRRGWSEAPGTPPYDRDGDPWDIGRVDRVTMEKARPGDPATRLTVRGQFAGWRALEPGDPVDAHYAIVSGDVAQPLEDVQWADWTSDGRLLAATRDGRLQIRAMAGDGFVVRSETDLSALTPTLAEPPPEANRWTG